MPIQLVPSLLCRSVHSLGYLQRLKLEIWTFESEKQIYSNRRVDQIGWSNRVIKSGDRPFTAARQRYLVKSALQSKFNSARITSRICARAWTHMYPNGRESARDQHAIAFKLRASLRNRSRSAYGVDLTTLRSKTNNQVKTKGAHWCRWRSPHSLRPTLLNAMVLISFRRKSLVQFWSLALSCWRCAVCRC